MRFLSLCLLVALVACQSTKKSNMEETEALPSAAGDAQAVHRLIDAWHAAAAAVDADAYLGALSADAVFMGTDPEERWDKPAFTQYVRHYFDDEKRGWTYVPSRRQVIFSPTAASLGSTNGSRIRATGSCAVRAWCDSRARNGASPTTA